MVWAIRVGGAIKDDWVNLVTTGRITLKVPCAPE